MSDESVDINYLRLDAKDVSDDLTARLQQIGYLAWADSLHATRTSADVRRVFAKRGDSQKFAAKRREYRHFAGEGTFIVASAKRGKLAETAIGFAMAKNDISPHDDPEKNLLRRAVYMGKRAVKLAEFATYIGEPRVYAGLKHVAVQPTFQGQRHGLHLVREATRPFEPRQLTTAYVFSENTRARAWFEGLGYELDPFDPELTQYDPPGQKPRQMTEYFGADQPPVNLLRYAVRLETLRSNIDQKLAT